jgi:KaiC/GvpD/RAD55 family RecA-like ATPase
MLVDAAGYAGGENPELVGRAFDDAIRKLDGAVYRPTYGAEFCVLPPEDDDPGRLDRRSLRDRIVRPTDCADGPRRGYIVKGLLAPGDVAAVIGQPGCGKSVWAPHVAYALAQGRRAFGLRTKQGAVLYLAAEDFAGMRQRVAALRGKHGDAPLFGMADIGNLRDAGQADELLVYVEAEAPALVVIDTLGAAWAGMDENGAQDMSAVVALARRMAATGAAVVVVHHTPKNGDGTPRGHSVLNGTLDMSVLLERDKDSGIVRARLLKNRNGTPDIDMAFRVEAVTLGRDEDGDPITAPIAAELADQAPSKAKLSPAEGKALTVLRGLVSASDEAWCEACDLLLSTAASVESRGRAFRRARAELVAKGYVAVQNGAFVIADTGSEFDVPLGELMA